jgi:alpha-tubulin suppressor-like RCC1 family protein
MHHQQYQQPLLSSSSSAPHHNNQVLFGTGEFNTLIQSPIQIPNTICNPAHRIQESFWHQDLMNEGIRSIHSGIENTVIVSNHDNLFVVGSWTRDSNSNNNNNNNNSNMKKIMKDLELKKYKIQQISCGNNHCLVLFENGAVYAFGMQWTLPIRSFFGQKSEHKLKLIRIAANFGPIQYVAACQSMSIIVDKQSRVYSAGTSIYSCLGREECVIGKIVNQLYSPDHTEITSYRKLLLPNERITQVMSGYAHVFALTDRGRVFCHGYSYHGECGINKRVEINEAMLVPFFEENGIVVSQIACGMFHTLFMTSNRHIYVTGKNIEGALGLGESVENVIVPTRVDLNGVIPTGVQCGGKCSFVTTDKGVYFTGNLRHHRGSDSTFNFTDFYQYCYDNWWCTAEQSALSHFNRFYSNDSYKLQISVGDAILFLLFSRKSVSFSEKLASCDQFVDVYIRCSAASEC